ncbi:MAG: universal stress protein [Trueperaceae bacterium]|nr:universal stress protein [Trueperaceae bacterium]
MFSHLLLPLTGTDLDRPAIAHARDLALESGGTVELMYVLEGPAGGPQAVDAVEWHARRLAGQAYLEQVIAQLADAGLTVSHCLPEGRVTEHIVHRAHQGADLLVLPTGASGHGHVGAVEGQVLWRSFVSTLLVRGDAPARHGGGLYGTVLVALDGSQRAECVLPAVRFLAERFGAHVILAHVVEEPSVPRPLPPVAEERQLAARLVELNTAAATKYLGDLATGLGNGAETRLVAGRRAAPVLHELVRECEPDLVVMSAHGYGGDHTWPFGEVTTNLIGYGPTPLLVIHDLPWQERAARQSDATEEEWGG